MSKFKRFVSEIIDYTIVYAIPAAVIVLGAKLIGLDEYTTWKQALGLMLIITGANVSGQAVSILSRFNSTKP